jgi:hypothetical protein
MNWEETRKAIIMINPDLENKLPKRWRWRIDLRGADLGGANLRDADLRDADLRGADLSGAYLWGANLMGADLWGADLRGADLRGADLRGADLRGADLWGANLRDADLWDANLGDADLRDANLGDAYLGGANLRGAYLGGAKINFNNHDIVAELLRREAGDDIDKLKLAGFVLLMRGWCWDKFVRLDDPLKEWALEALSQYVVDGDNAPKVLRKYAKMEEA